MSTGSSWPVSLRTLKKMTMKISARLKNIERNC